MDYLFVALGLAGLFAGGEFLVRGSVAMAHRFALSPLPAGGPSPIGETLIVPVSPGTLRPMATADGDEAGSE